MEPPHEMVRKTPDLLEDAEQIDTDSIGSGCSDALKPMGFRK